MSNFKKVLIVILCIAMVAGGFAVFTLCQKDADPTETPTPETGSESEEIPSTVLVGQFTDKKITDAQVAIEVVKDAAEKLGLTNATDELTVTGENQVEDLTYYRLQQNYSGIPVYGSSIVVVSDKEGTAKGLTSQAMDITEVNTTPTVTPQTVQAKLMEHFNTLVFAPDLTNELLTIYRDENRDMHILAYELVTLIGGEEHNAIVDAQSGEVLKAFSNVYTADKTVPTVEEMLKDYIDVYDADGKYFCKKILVCNDTQYLSMELASNQLLMYNWDGKLCFYNVGNTVYDGYDRVVNTSNWRSGQSIYKFYVLEHTSENKWTNVVYTSLTPMDESQIITQNGRAYLFAEKIAYSQGFFLALFGREGYDDNNGQIIAVFDDKSYDQNAYSLDWNGKTIICIGTNEPITTDLIAHEYMHSVEGTISSMVYEGESGAIMEGYSDLFGELVENWTSGKCDWVHSPNATNRNVGSPSATNNPSQYFTDDNWYTGTDESKRVHQNSTVVSHAGYLMTQSSTGGKALTMDELARLWYHTLYTLPKTCTFNALRQNMLMVAESLNYSKDQIKCITAAFDAVAIDGMDGIDNSATAWETYSNKDLTLQVYGKDMELFGNYTVDINSFKDKTQDTHIRVTNTKPVELKTKDGKALKPGTYTIVVANAQDTTQRVKKNIRIVADASADNTIYFATTFEKVTQTIPVDTQEPVVPEDTQAPVIPEDTQAPETPNLPESQGLAFTSNGDGTCYVSGIGTCTDTDIVIPKSSPAGDKVIAIGQMAFLQAESIETVVIPYGVVSIEMGAFAHCWRLRSIVIPDSITGIGKQAFFSCYRLTTVTLGKGVANVGEWAFSGCKVLTSISFEGTIAQWNEIKKVDNWNEYTPATEVVCSDGIAYLNSTGADQNNAVSEGLEFTSNGDGTCYVSGIGICQDRNVIIPVLSSEGDLVVSIGNSAFARCSSLYSVSIPNCVTSIGYMAFNSCYNLTSIHIPDGTTDIEECAFSGCSGLTSITLGHNLINIGAYAFEDCTSLESVVIPDNVVMIGDRAFQYCTKLTSVTFGKGVTTIGKGAFKLCGRLTSVTIPGNVKKIGSDAFASCTRMTEVVIGLGITEIHPCAFFVSKNITDVYFTGAEDQWYDITGVGQIKEFDDVTFHFNYTP